MYIINTIPHGKCFVRYLRTRCFCIRNRTRSLRSLVRFLIRQQLVRKYRTPALSMKYSLYLQANAYGYSYNHQPAKQGLETPFRSRQQNQVLTMEWNSKGAILPSVPHSSTIQTCWVQGSVAVRRCGRQEVAEKKHLYLAKRKEIFHATDER